MQDRFKSRVWDKTTSTMHYNDFVITATGYVAKLEDLPEVARKRGVKLNAGVFLINQTNIDFDKNCTVMLSTGLKDEKGKIIFEGDIIVIPNQYPFYDYKNEEDMKQDLNSTEGEIKGESVLNYIGIVEWIYSQWQYVYHCVNPNKRGISEGINQGLNYFGFDEPENTCYEVIGNIYENPELLEIGVLA